MINMPPPFSRIQILALMYHPLRGLRPLAAAARVVRGNGPGTGPAIPPIKMSLLASHIGNILTFITYIHIYIYIFINRNIYLDISISRVLESLFINRLKPV